MSKYRDNKLLFFYQLILAITFVFVFFTNFDVYWNHAIGTPQPKNLVILFGLASLPLLLSFASRIKYISKSLCFWIYGYVFISLTSFILYANYEPIASSEEIRTRILSAVFMLLSSLIFSCPKVLQWVRWEILMITFMNVIANVYSLFYPDNFVTIIEDQSVLETSRAAGFYVDANRATCILVLGLIFSITLLPQKYRLPFIFLIFIGAFVTFSRSGLISFLVVTFIMIFARQIRLFHKKMLFWAVSLGIIAWILLNSIGLSWLNIGNVEETVFENRNLERITQLQPNADKRELDDLSSERLPIVEKTWDEFLESPIWGNGIGYGLKLEADIIGKKSHNMYLSYMLEHGFLGALFLPLLVFCSTHNASRSDKYICFAFSALILIWAFFSHNILEHREFLMSFSLMSTISVTSELEPNFQDSDRKLVFKS
ncbi:MAG: O-antigen ligase family protein [Goleter apudmare HA4340-LM2]|jgi:hypothetical protein|nr:O-antigen ligase family protein [Goleter apudmare HA4340-LM2]